MSSVGAVMRGAAATGLASSARNLPSASASLNASAMLPLLAKNGARSIAAVRKSENGDTATTAATRRSTAAACKRDRGAHRRPHQDDRPRRDAIEHAREVLLLVEAVRAGVPARLAVRAAVVGDDVEPARQEVIRDPDAGSAVVGRRRGDRRASRASRPHGTTSPSASRRPRQIRPRRTAGPAAASSAAAAGAGSRSRPTTAACTRRRRARAVPRRRAPAGDSRMRGGS